MKTMKNDIKLQAMSYSDTLALMGSSEIEIPTLGGQKKLKVKKEQNFIHITNSNNKSLKVDQNLWDKVMDRMNTLPQEERGMSSRYGDGKNLYNWKECPNRVFAIYIPAIVKHLSK